MEFRVQAKRMSKRLSVFPIKRGVGRWVYSGMVPIEEHRPLSAEYSTAGVR